RTAVLVPFALISFLLTTSGSAAASTTPLRGSTRTPLRGLNTGSASHKAASSTKSKSRSQARGKESAVTVSTGCTPCEAAARRGGPRLEPVSLTTRATARRTRGRLSREKPKLACHPKDYVDPKIARNYQAAMREMKRAGIAPHVTSAWRSSDDQAEMRRC